MIRVSRFRLYPSQTIASKLFCSLDLCCFVYNYCLEHHHFKDNILPQLKRDHPELYGVHSIVLQNVVHQLQSNLRALHILKGKGMHVGRLRFKKRFHSMVFEQTGFKIEDGKLLLSKIGSIPLCVSEPISVVKQVIIKYNRTHKWFACLVCSASEPLPSSSGRRAVGIDLNVSNFCTDSDGLVVGHPQNIRKSEKQLARQQQKLSRKKKCSSNRRRQRTRVALVHERTENRRNDFLHKLSRYYVDNYDLITLEDLNINGLIKINGPGMRKSILDASWGKFVNYCGYKAENAGKRMVQVDPKNTTQECNICGTIVKKDLKERWHKCPSCGCSMPRDYNSALVIMKRGLKKVGWGTPEPSSVNRDRSTLAEIKAYTLTSELKQASVAEARISLLCWESVNHRVIYYMSKKSILGS